MKPQKAVWRIALAMLLLTTPALAQDIGTPDADILEDAIPERPYSPYAGGAVPTRVFWGETHQHTSFSMDAGAFGFTTSLAPSHFDMDLKPVPSRQATPDEYEAYLSGLS